MSASIYFAKTIREIRPLLPSSSLPFPILSLTFLFFPPLPKRFLETALVANGEDFVRQGFVSKDGWRISFDHV